MARFDVRSGSILFARRATTLRNRRIEQTATNGDVTDLRQAHGDGRHPQAAVARHAVIASITLDEKLELLHSLQWREPVELPVVELAPPTA
jgi:hypothetical protein